MPDINGNPVKRFYMALHIQELCADHNIAVKFTNDPSQYSARRGNRPTITIRPTRNTGYYVSALHEIGHILSPHQGNGRNHDETDAWFWARENSKLWTATAERIMRRALDSYGAEYPTNRWPEYVTNEEIENV